MIVGADELQAGKALAMRIVDAPCPQPMSATRAPAESFSTTPSSAGSHDVDEVREVAGSEEALGAREQVVMVLVPAEALARAEALGDVRLVLDDRCERAGTRRG